MPSGSFAGKMRVGHMTEREYRANIDGLNIFFGGLLGFVLASSEALSDVWFALLLVFTSGLVVTILYITASKHRVVYSVLAWLMISTMHTWLKDFLPGEGSIPSKLQPCLAVWALLIISVEFLPRERGDAGGETISS